MASRGTAMSSISMRSNSAEYSRIASTPRVLTACSTGATRCVAASTSNSARGTAAR